MGLSSRHYLFADDDLYRMSNRVMSDLVSGEYTLPQYAGTKQGSQLLSCRTKTESRPKSLRSTAGTIALTRPAMMWKRFGKRQPIYLLANIRLPGIDIDKSSTVVDIGPEVRRERFMREHRGELTKHDLDRIAADIWKKPMVAEKVKDVKGVAGRGKLKRAPKGP
jgi:hypothetical protein